MEKRNNFLLEYILLFFLIISLIILYINITNVHKQAREICYNTCENKNQICKEFQIKPSLKGFKVKYICETKEDNNLFDYNISFKEVNLTWK